jgi:acyl carrier protein
MQVMNSADYLDLMNRLGTHVKPRANAFHAVQSLQEPLADAGLDSLDIVLLSVYICEIFGIAEELGKSLTPKTFAELVSFVQTHQTCQPASVEAAMASIV